MWNLLLFFIFYFYCKLIIRQGKGAIIIIIINYYSFNSSAIINNKGEVIKKLNPNEAGNIELKVPLIKSGNKNKNDLIFFILLFTYILIFNLNKKNNDKQ